MRQWKIGIVGIGAAAKKIHLPAYKKIKRLEVVGGVDPIASQADFKFPIFDSLMDMMEKTKPEIVAIITPPESHFTLTCEALHAGAHVFCEKPFVSTLSEGYKVIELSKKVRRHVTVNNEFRFMNVHEKAAEQIGTTKFGELLFLSLNQTFHTTDDTEAGWRGESTRRTCYEFGTHALDLCRYFYNEAPIAISARMPKPGDRAGPDYLNLIEIEFAGDRFAHIVLDRLSRGPHRYLDIRLDGSVGCIESKLGGAAEAAIGIQGGSRKPYMRFEFAPSAAAKLYGAGKTSVLATDPIDLFANATAKLLEAMLKAIENDEIPPCIADENMHTLALMFAAYDSAERGGERIILDNTMGKSS